MTRDDARLIAEEFAKVLKSAGVTDTGAGNTRKLTDAEAIEYAKALKRTKEEIDDIEKSQLEISIKELELRKAIKDNDQERAKTLEKELAGMRAKNEELKKTNKLLEEGKKVVREFSRFLCINFLW